jgi:hypothetical protein
MTENVTDTDSAQEPQIDQSFPGSSPDENDGVTQHLDGGETLDADIDQTLDAGWIPLDRDPGIDVPTVAEQEAGESLDDKLAQEVPDVGQGEQPLLGDELSEVGDERSGRLVSATDPDGILAGQDVGIDGAAAAGEEAAVHVLDEQ